MIPLPDRALSPILSWIAIALLLAAAGGGFVAGDRWASRAARAEMADLKADQALTEARAAKAARDRLAAAQARGDALTGLLAAADQARLTQAQEHTHAIARLTAGRPCLDAGAVRLLNGPGPGIHAPAVSPPAGGFAAADAGSASDTDVATWIDGARGQYGQCRDRLQALIDYFAEHPQ